MTRPYPSYTDSGVDWLGLVPTHWEITQIKHACRIFPSNVDKHSKENERRVYLCNYMDVYYREEITSNIGLMVSTASDREIEKFTLRAGDVVFTKDSETADDIAVAAFVPRDLEGVVCGYHLYISRPSTGTDGAFIKRFFDSSFARACFEVRANGLTRVGLSQHGAENVPIALPPFEEQRAIAAFLDRETGKIDAAVEEQRRLIALLKEKRQAVISHAVTKGLNPDAPMKPSGIDWLGDIPEHWEIRQLKRLASLRSGDGITSDAIEDEGTYPVYGGNGLRGFTEEFTHEGDYVLIGRQGALCGNINYASGRFWASEHALVVNPVVRFVVTWLGELLRAMNLNQYSTSAAQPGIAADVLKEIWIPVPPYDEQELIGNYLIKELSKSSALIAEVEAAIDLLQERRSALISAAVTGKIDVREEVAEQEGEQSFERIEASVGA